ncbi:perlucin-like [Anopheles marshallii]|uniref:perlucin-like n=1 Tax=Anopheles marshallii TaxID=1521116 RepID=UPI00237A6DCF|nr:perlucin-like [Anopheles marshallii]
MSFKTFLLSLCVVVAAFNSIEAKKSFIVFSKSSTFFEAWQDCNSFDGYLASIQSPFEQRQVEQAMAKASNPNGIYFIGGTDLGRDGRWMWIGLNRPLNNNDYRNYYPGEPNNLGGDQHCLTVGNWQAENRGKWDDQVCSKKLDGYVCAFEK